MTHLPSGTLTFLLTDIEGSAAKWERHPKVMPAALARHNALVRAHVEQHGGLVIKERGEGDSFFTLFRHATDAVAAACDLQRALWSEPWPPEAPLRVRVALHTGEAEPLDGDYFGTVPNRCARLRAIAHGGQAILSQATRALVRDALPPGVTLRSLGKHRLRDLRTPEEVFQILHAELPDDFPPLPSVDAFPNNLPVQLTSFVGRDSELADLRARLSAARLVTLTGEGGCGKTRLALHLAADVLHDFPDGVWLIELAALTDAVEVPREVAAVLGVREESDRPLIASLVERLGQAKHLVILDNCERLLDASASLAETLLLACPSVHVVATSREPLHCRGEMVYLVPPLSVPPAMDVTADLLRKSDASRLFVARAEFSRATFVATEATAPAIARICARLDGNPLAIELAAAHVDALSPPEIETHLFEVLKGGPRTAPERQRSVESTIDWSYHLLSEREQRLFHRLSAFAGGWSLDAAEAVGTGSDIATDDVDDLLAALVRKSLVVREESPDGLARYRLHETVRQFAWRRLEQSDEARVVERCHANYFLRLAEEAEPELKGPHQKHWLDRLEGESDNVRAALRCMREHRVVESGLRMGAALWRFWYMRGYLSEGREQLTRALALTDAADHTAARAKALHGAGTLASLQGDFETARGCLEEAQAICRELGDIEGEKRAVSNLGMLAYDQGDYSAARHLYERSLQVNQDIGDEWGIATSLGNLASIEWVLGELETAYTHAILSLEIRGMLGDRSTQAAGLTILGLISRDRGEYDAALRYFDESLTIFRELGDRGGVAQTLIYLGLIAHDQGDLDIAHDWYAQSLALAQEYGQRSIIAEVLAYLGELAYDQGEIDMALARFKQAESTWPAAPYIQTFADFVAGTGRAELRSGHITEAETLLRKSLMIRREVGNPIGLARSVEEYSMLACSQGNHERAIRLAGAAARIRDSMHAPLPAVRRQDIDRWLSISRGKLPPEAADRAWAEGRAMTWEQAVAYVHPADTSFR